MNFLTTTHFYNKYHIIITPENSPKIICKKNTLPFAFSKRTDWKCRKLINSDFSVYNFLCKHRVEKLVNESRLYHWDEVLDTKFGKFRFFFNDFKILNTTFATA